jgi:hypothetical protein
MGQDDIFRIIKRSRGVWFSKSNLKPLVSCNDASLNRSISRLVKFSRCYGLRTRKGIKGKNFIRFD